MKTSKTVEQIQTYLKLYAREVPCKVVASEIQPEYLCVIYMHSSLLHEMLGFCHHKYIQQDHGLFSFSLISCLKKWRLSVLFTVNWKKTKVKWDCAWRKRRLLIVKNIHELINHFHIFHFSRIFSDPAGPEKPEISLFLLFGFQTKNLLSSEW